MSRGLNHAFVVCAKYVQPAGALGDAGDAFIGIDANNQATALSYE